MQDRHLSRESEEFLEDLAEELRVPDTRYDQAERSYKSLGEWLHRPASTVRQFDPQVYVQGSFRLGTTIRPSSDADEYDIDAVCEFQALEKGQITQRDLKTLLGTEIEGYRVSKGMSKPLREGRRCWVLSYADGAQFHMDVVPAVPNAADVRGLLEASRQDAKFVATAIAITDNTSLNYTTPTRDWPRSNPKGYATWFQSRMAGALERRKRVLAEREQASVEAIPDFRVRTPLQAAVMILKRHRDHSYADNPDVRPISVIITTLAAHAYGGEETIGQALATILSSMDTFVEQRSGRYWIANPTDALENFADKWAERPDKAEAFFAWLAQARREFEVAARSTDRNLISEELGSGVGQDLARRTLARRSPTLLRTASVAPAGGLSFPDRDRAPTRPKGFASA